MTQQEFIKRFSYNVRTDKIGGGSFGNVYKAYDNTLHREVAIKVSEVKTTADGQKTFSLKDEFEALAHVPKHPNIANYEELYSFEGPQGVFDYAVMQYYPDGNLSSAIKQGLTAEQKEDIATQLLEGIDFLHQHKVVHRDLKPGNILVVRHSGKVIPLITDFGLSKAANVDDGSMFSNSFGGGTPRYSSPEQLEGKPLRFNTDLWSLGAILYELFTGEQLFMAGSGTAAELEIYNKIVHGDVRTLDGLPEKWRRVAERCLVVNPDRRARSVDELRLLIEAPQVEEEDDGEIVPPVSPVPAFEETVADVATAVPSARAATSEETSVEVAAVDSNENTVAESPSDHPQPRKRRVWPWILGIGTAAAVVVLLVLLLKPKPTDPDAQAYQSCQTVADSIDQAETGQRTKEEDSLYNACSTIEACDKYLKAFPEGRFVTEVQNKKAELEKNAMKNSFNNGHEYVDLGLPSGTLWATCNVGASKPEDYGSYFAWGETKTKTNYSWETYKYTNGDIDYLTKYSNNSRCGNNGFTDNLTTLQAIDDAATAKWGSGWRTPSKAQWEELLNYTTQKWTTKNGKKGYLFTSKKNGSSIFLPAAGYRASGKFYLVESVGAYMSRTLNTDRSCSDDSRNLYFYSSGCEITSFGRNGGVSVRPVCKK